MGKPQSRCPWGKRTVGFAFSPNVCAENTPATESKSELSDLEKLRRARAATVNKLVESGGAASFPYVFHECCKYLLEHYQQPMNEIAEDLCKYLERYRLASEDEIKSLRSFILGQELQHSRNDQADYDEEMTLC
mgnify:CR=1 FL=1